MKLSPTIFKRNLCDVVITSNYVKRRDVVKLTHSRNYFFILQIACDIKRIAFCVDLCCYTRFRESSVGMVDLHWLPLEISVHRVCCPRHSKERSTVILRFSIFIVNSCQINISMQSTRAIPARLNFRVQVWKGVQTQRNFLAWPTPFSFNLCIS